MITPTAEVVTVVVVLINVLFSIKVGPGVYKENNICTGLFLKIFPVNKLFEPYTCIDPVVLFFRFSKMLFRKIMLFDAGAVA